jgi:hypothetical protein
MLDAHYFVPVTSLEAVVLELQDSWRETQSNITMLHQETALLHHQLRQQEMLWRAMWEGKKLGPEDVTSVPTSFSQGKHNGTPAAADSPYEVLSSLSYVAANRLTSGNLSFRIGLNTIADMPTAIASMMSPYMCLFRLSRGAWSQSNAFFIVRKFW